MRFITVLIRAAILGLIAMLLGSGFVYASEIDDATVFVEAFNAFQKKDYLLALEKTSQINQVFPDSPLRDLTLLLIARSSIKSGDNQLAAITINKFMDEFSDSALKSTIEEELLALGSRLKKGESLQPNKQLQEAALKIKNDRLLLERAAALKLEQEKLAKEKAERERLAFEKAESERRERERLAAEKAEKESIKTVITLLDSGSYVAAGQNGNMPIEISNRGKSSQEFLVEVSAAPEYAVSLVSAGKPDETVAQIKLAAGKTFNGKVLFRMPADKVDGHRASLTIKTISSKFSDVIQVKNTHLVASAPLVRVVAKLAKPQVAPGEQLRYRVTVLNIGSQAAQDLTVRVQLPPQLDFMNSPDLKFQKEQDGTLVFRVERIETGKLAEISLDVKVRGNSRIGEELRGRIEVLDGQLHRKDIFTTSASVVQPK
ncbi:MAG: hypothetical protein PHD54_01815 [Desulfuromonadaceae bacterium]|nr:hypothetical protein [Desulfuromonadaceae bacterium]